MTTAITELATQNLVSGMARFAGAAAVLLKLVFGAAAGTQLALMLGWSHPSAPASAALPLWWIAAALLAAGANFAFLFRAAPRDYPLVTLAVCLGYGITHFASRAYGAEFGVFAAGLAIGLLANGYARRFNRPGALLRVPGIIMLVPGGLGFKSLFFTFSGDISQGLETAVRLTIILISLVSGLLFANTILAPRKTLS